ncbi:MAG: LysR family transcriptional regulator [Pseudorhodoplanes sp.]
MRHMRIWQYVDEVARSGSIRRAAEKLNVTPSAVQRRIQDIEQDLGAELFERSKQGMQITAAGELFLRWVRTHVADLDRVQSQIEDLSGLRRGRIRMACSQAVVHTFLPEEIARFTSRYPLVSFHIDVCDHDRAIQLLSDLEADLALIFSPGRPPDLRPIIVLEQRLVALMAPAHPLAAKKTVRLRDCLAYPIAVADRSFSSRQIVAGLLAGSSSRLSTRLESNSFELLRNFIGLDDTVAFHIEIGAEPGAQSGRFVSRLVDSRDLAKGALVLGHLKGRALPVAAAKFAEQLSARLDEMRPRP